MIDNSDLLWCGEWTSVRRGMVTAKWGALQTGKRASAIAFDIFLF